MRFRIVFLSFLLPLLVSCDNVLDNNALNQSGGGYKLIINALANAPESKDLLTATYFPNGSQLGVSVTNTAGGSYDGVSYNNVCFTANGSDANQTWSGASDVLLSNTLGYCYAYYPYSSSASDISSISVTTSTQTDYLYATAAAVSATNRTATLTMKHALAAVRLAIKLGTYSGTGALTSVSVGSAAIGTSALLNAKNGGLSGVTGKGTSIVVSKELSLSSTAQNVDVIVVPTGSAADLTLSVTIDGNTYSTVVSGSSVQQGECNTYILTVNAGELALSGIKVGDWSYNSAGSPTITAGGHTITFAGDYEDLLFQNKVVSDSEVTITTCSRSGKKVRPVTASAGSLTQTYDGVFSILNLTGISSDVTVNFDGTGVEEIHLRRYSVSGMYTWTVPDYVYSVNVFIVGGGGGGGVSMHSGGGGGGGGQVVQASLDVTPGEEIAVTVGKGGMSGYQYAAYTAYNGEAGGASSFASIVAKGGDGGQSAYGGYSGYRGAGGTNYTKGGDGAQVSRYGNLYASSGQEGTEYNGEIYGSGGGAGGMNEKGEYSNPTNGGTNAGNGVTMGTTDYSSTYALDGYGGGGGAIQGGESIKNGGDGTVIIEYKTF